MLGLGSDSVLTLTKHLWEADEAIPREGCEEGVGDEAPGGVAVDQHVGVEPQLALHEEHRDLGAEGREAGAGNDDEPLTV